MSKSFKGSDFSVEVSATKIKKLPFAVVYIKIDTTEKELLFTLTKQYKHERIAAFGVNPINGAFSMIVGVNGLVIECPENKITNNVSQYINYLGKSTVKPQFYISEKKGSYKKLVNDMKKIKLFIVGKCGTFIKNNILKDSAKMPKLLKTLDTIQFKEREDVVHKCSNTCCGVKCKCRCACCSNVCFNVSETEAIDIVHLLGDCSIKAEYSKGKLCLSGCCPHKLCCKLCKPTKTLSSKMKIYRTLTKNLEELNDFVFVFTNVRGLDMKHTKSSVEFDSEIIKKITEGCKECLTEKKEEAEKKEEPEKKKEEKTMIKKAKK